MFQKTTLDNGVRIISETIPSRTVAVGIWVDVGARDETPDNNGISHFLEHMLFKGTPGRSAQDIAEELDILGGMSNAFTSAETTAYYATVLDDQVERIVGLLADLFFHSLLLEEEVAREREVILQEISMVEDTPDDRIHELFASALWGDHPLGLTVLGRREGVSAIGAGALRQYLRQNYLPERIVIAASGNIQHEAFCRLWATQLGSLAQSGSDSPRQRRPPLPLPPVRQVHSKALEQVHIVLGTYGLAAADEDRYALHLFNLLLGGNMSSRLFQVIREKKGLAYSVYSSLSSYSDGGCLDIYLGVDQEVVNQALSLVAREIRALCRGDFTGVQLSNAKDYARAGIFLSAENMEARMSRIARNELTFGRFVSFDEIVAGFATVGRNELVELANRLFAGPLFATLLGPVQEGGIDWQVLDFPGSHEGG